MHQDVTKWDYIGDGVYVGFDGYHIWLKTDLFDGRTNMVAIEHNVYEGLKRFAKRINPSWEQ
jgi:hypothetical protein